MDEIEKKTCIRFRTANKEDKKIVVFKGKGG